ncbi:hypothetical protein [Massilia sp. GCM10023247]|uniref:hypothetical protein n=1 Tax=Massilia sp. GCM10023247 TaxID=3252643 RepID=UPI00360960B2
MKTVAAGLALGMVVALAGCAVPERKTDGELIAGSSASGAEAVPRDEQPMTGTRLAKRTTTERALRTVGSRDARDALDQSARPLNSSGQ